MTKQVLLVYWIACFSNLCFLQAWIPVHNNRPIAWHNVLDLPIHNRAKHVIQFCETTNLLPLASAVVDLERMLCANDCSRHVQVEGYVTAKRGFGNSFCFLDISDAQHFDVPVQAMIKQQDYQGPYFDGYMRSMVPGIRIRVTGVPKASRNPKEALLLVHRIQIIGLPQNPQHIRILLQAAHMGLLPMSEVANAANCSVVTLENSIAKAVNGQDNTSSDKERSNIAWNGLAKALMAVLPTPDDNYPEIILQQRHERAVYTLPSPTIGLEHPPDIVLQNRVTLNSDILVKSYSSVDSLLSDITRGSSGIIEVSVQGWVQNRRRFHGNITVLELVDSLEKNSQSDTYEHESKHYAMWHQRLKCILHPDCTGGIPDCGKQGQYLAPGSQVRLQGHIVPQDSEKNGALASPKSIFFWVGCTTLLQASWKPSVLNYLIELVVNGEIPLQIAGIALKRSQAEIEEVVKVTNLTERQWKAAEISVDLQNSSNRPALVKPSMKAIPDEFASLRAAYPVQSIDISSLIQSNTLRDGSFWKRKKEPQLIWMSDQVKHVVESHPEYGKRPLRILDVGGGKGHFANYLASILRDQVQIEVIDIAQGAIKNGAMRSKRLQLSIKYTVGDASLTNFQDRVDLVVALHACGSLTDVALGHAALSNASVVICPCCFRSNPFLKVPIGNGMVVPAEDFLGVDPAKYDQLTLLAEVQGDSVSASTAAHSICAIRAAAFESHTDGLVKVSLKSFSNAYSSRNFCLVGMKLQ